MLLLQTGRVRARVVSELCLLLEDECFGAVANVLDGNEGNPIGYHLNGIRKAAEACEMLVMSVYEADVRLTVLYAVLLLEPDLRAFRW